MARISGALRKISGATREFGVPQDDLDVSQLQDRLEGMARNLPGLQNGTSAPAITQSAVPAGAAQQEPPHNESRPRRSSGQTRPQQKEKRITTSVQLTAGLIRQMKIRIANEETDRSVIAFILDGLEKLGFDVEADKAYLRNKRGGERQNRR